MLELITPIYVDEAACADGSAEAVFRRDAGKGRRQIPFRHHPQGPHSQPVPASTRKRAMYPLSDHGRFLGIDIERFDDEMKPLTEYVKEVMAEDQPPAPSLTTISTGCSGCPPNQYRVSDSCRGCFARPCIANCPRERGELHHNGQAHIRKIGASVAASAWRCAHSTPSSTFPSPVRMPVRSVR